MFTFLQRVFPSRRAFIPSADTAAPEEDSAAPVVDPLDPLAKIQRWPEAPEPKLRSIADFPIYTGLAEDEAPETIRKASADAAARLVHSGAVMDDSDNTGQLKLQNDFTVPFALQSWYQSQGFIGHQACAIIAQHWLVDKACSMAGEDAARNGWVIKTRSGDDLDDASLDQLLKADKHYNIKENLIELNRLKNVFGIRVAIFKVKSDDKDYYTKPFNIDGITADSYIGISQVDPYWMTPVLTGKNTGDPSSIGFYEPEYWMINGVRYHKTHLVIVRGPQPADILKPTYIFGGIPLTQRIYERVYAAERTANEAPLLSMSKRTTAIHVDMERALADQCSFEERLMQWIRYRDNHAVKVLGKEESMEQFDISLSDFDSVIMNQYQIVAAIARVPATKLLGTSPKGFNATGEFEMKSYHEELESIQEHVMMPMLQRHYDIACRSIGIDAEIEVVCNPVDSITTKERAELNASKATTGVELINAGVISPEEERQRIREDEHSGYNRLSDEEAETEPGMSPENLAELQKAGAAEEKAQNEGAAPAPGIKPDEAETDVGGAENPALRAMVLTLLQSVSGGSKQKEAMAAMILALLHTATQTTEPNPEELDNIQPPIRGTKPGTLPTAKAGVGGVHSVIDVPSQDWSFARLPKMKFDGLHLAIENPRGTIRKGTNLDGSTWQAKMANHYGFIKGTQGADGDEMDCFVGPNLDSKQVFVINQKIGGNFDEHKCMLGFADADSAIKAYHDSFNVGWDGFMDCVPLKMADFKQWLASGDCTSQLGMA